MTAVLFDEVVTTPAPRLTLVPAPQLAPKQRDHRPAVTGGDPLVDGAARLLSVPVRHLYAALWRVGLLEVGA